jgi:hypothetical protein
MGNAPSGGLRIGWVVSRRIAGDTGGGSTSYARVG